MSREWKPGDVAMVTHASGAQRRCVRTHSGTWEHFWPDQFAWHDSQVTDVRPLIVLDLGGDYSAAGAVEILRDRPLGIHNLIADQIEAQTRTPKPPEPTGLGAVVEDAEGRRWVRFERPDTPARFYDASEAPGFPQRWENIAAVRVLSEGVPS